ncbi:hypothetical protein CLG96_07275 [Sphingomonas oleivorans]|uniref:Uncharacterized protein n=1 Tax=Sphingomonas oleivorans TaxID=1735121 RepID=A0A2T5G092_9SPHN|nr:tetratricopeptide repeat-containing sulfotransferase family protein [Sphingomonas oleivorans]PTQ12327.1 hypothetical protein CLG96_07275 [Sphingomonas oleivorans]
MASRVSEPVGTLATALRHADRLLRSDPALAERQASEILAVVPDHPSAMLLLARARRLCGKAAAARQTLLALAAAQPRSAATQQELALAEAALGEMPAAIAAWRRAVALDPADAEAWRGLADLLKLSGDDAGADAAHARAIKASVTDPELVEAALALCDERLAVAETLLRDRLKRHPTDVAAIRMFAEVAARLGRYGDAGTLLERCLELSPGFDAARRSYAQVLQRQNRPADALAEVDRLLARDPANPGYRTLRAAILVRLGDYEAAIALYSALLAEHPHQPKGWMSYGHALKTVGRRDEAIAAYVRAIEQAPALGEAWWSLANLKTYRFDDAQLGAMAAALDRPDLAEEDQLHLHFALAKAREDRGDHGPAFDHYARGNAIRRAQLRYDPAETSEHVRRSVALFDRAFFAARQGGGCDAPDPIFVVGLPRAGSTLVEQILASHPLVEGTMELPDLMAIARRLGEAKRRSETSLYPEILTSLSADDLRTLGEEYLARTRIQRKTDRPYFIDKMPNNWAHVGLIHLILPNAKIIDARRHPLGCCLSGFKQHFARGQGFTYGLEDIGLYYRDYVAFMAHCDAVLPGRVHRVIYESMIADTEGEVRRLLDHVGLPFDPACLAFWQNDRAVRTASSEQVRRPIFTDAVDHWRHFEPWLDPLKQALGPVLDAYPHAP